MTYATIHRPGCLAQGPEVEGGLLPRRCESGECDWRGTCLTCGADQGEACTHATIEIDGRRYTGPRVNRRTA